MEKELEKKKLELEEKTKYLEELQNQTGKTTEKPLSFEEIEAKYAQIIKQKDEETAKLMKQLPFDLNDAADILVIKQLKNDECNLIEQIK